MDWLKPAEAPTGCSVANVHGMDPPIAEYVLGTMIDNEVRFSKLQSEFRETGVFRPPFPRSGDAYAGRPFHGELGGKTLGIVGLGSIGNIPELSCLAACSPSLPCWLLFCLELLLVQQQLLHHCIPGLFILLGLQV